MERELIKALIKRYGGDVEALEVIDNCAESATCISRIEKVVTEIIDELKEFEDVEICTAALKLLSRYIDPVTSMALDSMFVHRDIHKDIVSTFLIIVSYVELMDRTDISRVETIIEKHVEKLDRYEKIIVLATLANVSASSIYGNDTRLDIPLALALIKSMNKPLHEAIKYVASSGIVIKMGELIKVFNSIKDGSTAKDSRLFAG